MWWQPIKTTASWQSSDDILCVSLYFGTAEKADATLHMLCQRPLRIPMDQQPHVEPALKTHLMTAGPTSPEKLHQTGKKAKSCSSAPIPFGDMPLHCEAALFSSVLAKKDKKDQQQFSWRSTHDRNEKYLSATQGIFVLSLWKWSEGKMPVSIRRIREWPQTTTEQHLNYAKVQLVCLVWE